MAPPARKRLTVLVTLLSTLSSGRSSGPSDWPALCARRLQLVKQRDPSGEKYGSDEIDLIAESEGLPARLQIEPTYGIYEHSLEVTLPADGRYAGAKLGVKREVPDHQGAGTKFVYESQYVETLAK